MADVQPPDKGNCRQPGHGESRWPKIAREIIETGIRFARLADFLIRIWHDLTRGGPGWPTRWC